MNIKFSMIDKELRAAGRVIKIINNTFTEPRLRLLSKIKFKMRVKDPSIRYSEEWIPREDGSKLRVCIFKPLSFKENVPGILWLHGGGYAIGSPERAKNMAKKFMEVSDCIVFAPEYRLSVDYPYPAALEDAYEALLWMKNNAERFGIRSNQLMVGGESAGGGLTASLTLYARDKGEVSIAFQMPLYPMLNDRMTSESAVDNNAPVWNSKSNYNAWKLYLGDLFGSQEVPPYAAPSRAMDYKNLPPTATFVGELEPFRDETIQYVKNLRSAGVPVEFEIYKGCYHAFEQIWPIAEVSKNATAFILGAYGYATKHYYKSNP